MKILFISLVFLISLLHTANCIRQRSITVSTSSVVTSGFYRFVNISENLAYVFQLPKGFDYFLIRNDVKMPKDTLYYGKSHSSKIRILESRVPDIAVGDNTILETYTKESKVLNKTFQMSAVKSYRYLIMDFIASKNFTKCGDLINFTLTAAKSAGKDGECPKDTFKCSSSLGLCLTQDALCDGVNNCDSGEDEANCESSTAISSLTSPPTTSPPATSGKSTSSSTSGLTAAVVTLSIICISELIFILYFFIRYKKRCRGECQSLDCVRKPEEQNGYAIPFIDIEHQKSYSSWDSAMLVCDNEGTVEWEFGAEEWSRLRTAEEITTPVLSPEIMLQSDLGGGTVVMELVRTGKGIELKTLMLKDQASEKIQLPLRALVKVTIVHTTSVSHVFEGKGGVEWQELGIDTSVCILDSNFTENAASTKLKLAFSRRD